MEVVLKKISRLILYLGGWEAFPETSENYKKYKTRFERSIITYSHTSHWDAILFLLYKFAHPEIFRYTIMPVKPQIYDKSPKWCHSILNGLGFVRATAYEEKNGGFVNTIVDILKKREKFSFLISPKGKIVNSPWRSGYYVIAKQLDCDIVSMGLDYERKRIFMFDPISVKHKSKDEIEPVLQKQIGEIVPFNPDYSEVPLRKYKRANVTLITVSIVVILLILFMTYLSWYYKVLFIAVIILFFILL